MSREVEWIIFFERRKVEWISKLSIKKDIVAKLDYAWELKFYFCCKKYEKSDV